MESIATLSIGERVALDWRKAEVFKKYDIDFCCRGKRSLSEACVEVGIDEALIEAELNELDKRNVNDVIHDFKNWELDILANYIVNRHHTYVKAAIPFLDELRLKVVQVHGDRHSELIDMNRHIQNVFEELSLHMHKEEMVLFPYIKQLADAKRNGNSVFHAPFGSIANPINMMEAEHISAGNSLREIEKLSNGFTPPADACTSYRVLFAKLREFQEDLQEHIHLENNILFHKALALEEALLIA